MLQELTLENAMVVLELLEASEVPNRSSSSPSGPAPEILLIVQYCVVIESRIPVSIRSQDHLTCRLLYCHDLRFCTGRHAAECSQFCP